MQIRDIIWQSQGGTIPASLALAAGCTPQAIIEALDKLVPLIAGQIQKKCDDPEEFELLMEVLESGEQDRYLDISGAFLSRAAIEDGEDILEHIYGSLDRARTMAKRSAAPAGMDEDNYARLMTITATLVLAAMARRNQYLIMPAVSQQADSPQPSIIAGLIAAIIEGFMQGFRTAITRKKRRRTSRRTYSRKRRSSRRRTTRRRKSSVSISNLIGDLFSSDK